MTSLRSPDQVKQKRRGEGRRGHRMWRRRRGSRRAARDAVARVQGSSKGVEQG
jgi:hypothetical protein